jgi:broad specificity phosphatase PhoE
MPGRLVILRHAESEWNAAGLWQGHADPPLSAQGCRHAALGAEHLARMGPFDAVFSSDLARAVQTADILRAALGLTAPLEVDAGLREYDVGEWSGRTREEIESLWPGDISRFSRGELAAPPRGEARSSFDRRVLEAAARVGLRAASAGVENLLVVAHGGVVRALARLAGVAEYRVGHMAGYRGHHETAGLFPEEPLDLLDLELASGSP